ncbi:helix-turn-helix domain-containing protein [Alistipes onderdonkii]|jgi:transcriptional regulator with XRE-family HTH domain|uniref:helix-turn-helix domain-containing protein n=1 Tax=Alistipes onderdonkii TaxID=328813 RepID=UPI00189AF451|nr:helix-turn-helix transcriptional regulator [Alistipes onderdonkii]DAQ51010.1 MAG TPA: helix-turn-helix domain protein [Caudoviricetes sp.]
MTLRVKEVSKAQGVSITKLAELVGITQPNMSNIANGKTSPSLDLLERIAGALGVSVPELFAPQPTNTITCPHCGKLIKVEKGE